MAIVLPRAVAVEGDTPCPCKVSPNKEPPPAASALLTKSLTLPPLEAVAITLAAMLLMAFANVAFCVMVFVRPSKPT